MPSAHNSGWRSAKAQPAPAYYPYYRTAPEFHGGPAAHRNGGRDDRWQAVRYDGHAEYRDGYRHHDR
jgi:hypothetical protein